MLRNKTVYRFYYENCLIMKEMAKELGRIGQPLSSVYWYMKYICKKIITKYLAIGNR